MGKEGSGEVGKDGIMQFARFIYALLRELLITTELVGNDREDLGIHYFNSDLPQVIQGHSDIRCQQILDSPWPSPGRIVNDVHYY